MWKCPSSIWWQDLISQPSDYESPPLTRAANSYFYCYDWPSVNWPTVIGEPSIGQMTLSQLTSYQTVGQWKKPHLVNYRNKTFLLCKKSILRDALMKLLTVRNCHQLIYVQLNFSFKAKICRKKHRNEFSEMYAPDQCDQKKIAKCLYKLPKNHFTGKMIDFDTFTKIA